MFSHFIPLRVWVLVIRASTILSESTIANTRFNEQWPVDAAAAAPMYVGKEVSLTKLQGISGPCCTGLGIPDLYIAIKMSFDPSAYKTT